MINSRNKNRLRKAAKQQKSLLVCNIQGATFVCRHQNYRPSKCRHPNCRQTMSTLLINLLHRGGSGLIFLGSSFILQAQAFSGLKNLLNKSGFIQAWVLLHKQKNGLRPEPNPQARALHLI
jgi:hypothetical protein